MRAIVSIASLIALGGCVTELPPQPASFDAVIALRKEDVPPISLGEFRRGAELSLEADKSVAIRADSFRAPSGSFATYLRETVRGQLVSAGKLDDDAPRTLSAELIRSEVETSLPTSSAALAARFTVAKPDGSTFTKVLTASDEWPSSFFGFVAITEAGQRYSALYQALASAVFSDPEIRRALSGSVAAD